MRITSIIPRIALALPCALPLTAQAPRLAAQPVLLELRPRVGDTLYLRLDQEMEMRGTPHAPGDSARVLTATMRVLARAIPISVAGDITTLVVITDSLASTSQPVTAGALERARRAMIGRRVEVRVAADGAIDVVTAEHSDDPSPLFGEMPAILPGRRVRPGDRWSREMRIPLSSGRTPRAAVRAVFRFDSLSRNGQVAYLSVNGTIAPRNSTSEDRQSLSGTLSGAIQFDRRRRWITDSRTTVTALSHVRAADLRAAPMDVWMRVTQRLRADMSR